MAAHYHAQEQHFVNILCLLFCIDLQNFLSVPQYNPEVTVVPGFMSYVIKIILQSVNTVIIITWFSSVYLNFSNLFVECYASTV